MPFTRANARAETRTGVRPRPRAGRSSSVCCQSPSRRTIRPSSGRASCRGNLGNERKTHRAEHQLTQRNHHIRADDPPGGNPPVSPPGRPPPPGSEKPQHVSSIPIAIFMGVDGSRPLELSHRQNRTSGIDKTTTQNGLIALEITPETSVPSIKFKVKIWIRIGVTLEASSRCCHSPSRSSCFRFDGTPSRTRSRSRK